MIDKEAAELRRRLRPDRSNITKIHGCYINQFGEIVTTFDDSMAMLPVEEQEKYHELLKKAVSGTMGKTLSDVVFSTAQVQSSPEHGLLMKLRNSKLSDAEARKELYGKIAATVRLGENVGVLLLLACDTYDVPYRSGDGEIPTERIGDMVMSELKQLNDVAYVRFAAVYRKFTDLGTFMDELQKLLNENKADLDHEE
jgi:hypothetical protein